MNISENIWMKWESFKTGMFNFWFTYILRKKSILDEPNHVQDWHKYKMLNKMSPEERKEWDKKNKEMEDMCDEYL